MSAIKKINIFIFGMLPGLILIIFSFLFWNISYTSKIKNKLIENHGDSIFYIKYCEGDFDDMFIPVYSEEEYKKIRIKECQQLKENLN